MVKPSARPASSASDAVFWMVLAPGSRTMVTSSTAQYVVFAASATPECVKLFVPAAIVPGLVRVATTAPGAPLLSLLISAVSFPASAPSLICGNEKSTPVRVYPPALAPVVNACAWSCCTKLPVPPFACPKLLTRKGLLTPPRLSFIDEAKVLHAPVVFHARLEKPSPMLQPAWPPPSSLSEPVRRINEADSALLRSITRKYVVFAARSMPALLVKVSVWSELETGKLAGLVRVPRELPGDPPESAWMLAVRDEELKPLWIVANSTPTLRRL